MNKNLSVLLLSKVLSGHEIMAMKILSQMTSTYQLIISQEVQMGGYFGSRKVFLAPKNVFSLIKVLQHEKVFLVSGSPYGHLITKCLLRLFGKKICEYTPFPELPEIRDRFHHRLAGLINRVCVNKRILIEEWQIKYSCVKNVKVVQNVIG